MASAKVGFFVNAGFLRELLPGAGKRQQQRFDQKALIRIALERLTRCAAGLERALSVKRSHGEWCSIDVAPNAVVPRERVAVERLERGNPFAQGLTPGCSVLTLVPFREARGECRTRAIGIAGGLELSGELIGFFGLARLERRDRELHPLRE